MSEHAHPANRRLHYIGTALTFVILAMSIAVGNYWLLIAIPICGYGFAWYGHFRIELNRPATFKYPLWSLVSDYKMFFMLILGRLKGELKIAQDKYPQSFNFKS